MDMEEIRYLLGSTIFARAKAYLDRVEDLDCETSENGVRHLTADVRGGGRNRYHTQAWLRENGSFVSASCTCPYNENGEGPCCKHIGALLMLDEEGKTQPAAAEPVQKPQLNNIPGVVRGTEFAQESAARKDSYASSLEMLFGKNGGAMSRKRMPPPVSCCGPIRKIHWLSCRSLHPKRGSAGSLPSWNRN